MSRRLWLLASLSGSLVACASILGDFEVEPAGADADASTDGGTSSGNLADGATDPDGSQPLVQPAGVQVATSTSATCATVQYASGKQVTYCWGAQLAKYPEATVGVQAGDPNVDGFYRPRLPTAEVNYLTFSVLTGAGTGDWFAGRGTSREGATATYTWGSNDNGEAAAGAAASTAPNALKSGVNFLQFDSLYAAPGHGCLTQGTTLYCWGSNANCEVRSGDRATCNLGPPPLTDAKVRTVEDQTTFPSGNGGQVLRMAGGNDHTCTQVRTTDVGGEDDTIRCWGTNSQGQVNASGVPFINTPTDTGVKVRRASAELAAGENHTCAITGVNKLACWGRNNGGQANPNAAGPPAAVTEVDRLQGALSLLRASFEQSCVVAKPLNEPSRAWCWGNGPKGRAAGASPTGVGQVAGIQDITALALGRAHACAVAKKEGATAADLPHVYCWGTNDFKRIDPRAEATAAFAQPVEIRFPAEPTN